MTEFNLKPQPFLGDYHKSFSSAELREIGNLEIVSIACPLGGRQKLQARTEAAFGIALPDAGASSGSMPDGLLLIGMGPDQWFAIFESEGTSALGCIQAALGTSGYFTRQTDSWIALRLTGGSAAAALERICPIDLHPSVFPSGSAARTAMEHLSALIYCEDSDSFMLLSASSSARSLLHAVETSIEFVS